MKSRIHSVKAININQLLRPNLSEQIQTDLYENLSSYEVADIVQFYPSENNLFLEKLALRATRSVTNADCLRTKTRFSTGTGIQGIKNDDELDEEFQEFLINFNNLDQDFYEVINSEHYDDWCFGNSYLEHVKIGDKITTYYKDATTIRAVKPKKGFKVTEYLYAPDWTRTDIHGNAIEEKFEPVKYSAFPKFEKVEGASGLRCISHFKFSSPGLHVYGMPEYISSLRDIDLEYRISKYNLDEFDNNFAADLILTFFSDTDDEKEAKALKSSLKDEYVGENNNGKPLVQIVPQDAKSVQVDKIDRNTDGAFDTLSERVFKNIARAHGTPLSLLSSSQAGQLGNTQQFRNEYEYFMNVHIKPYQANKIRYYKKLWKKFKEIGATNIPEIPEEVKFINSNPVSYREGVDVNSVMLISEKRAYAGLEALDDEEKAILLEEQKTTKNVTNNTATDQE